MQNPVTVVEINPGPKIAWEQDGYKLIFGDDDLILRCDRRQKDWAVHEDISVDDNGNLKLGVGRYYVAQVDIPPRSYIETEPVGDGEEQQREALPLDMADVTLTLWNIDAIR